MERLTDIINGWTFEETIKTAESLMEAEKNMFKWDVLRHLRNFAENYREQIKEYQQLEEQGRLLKPPCKIGDDVYFVPSEVNYKLNILNKHSENNKVYHQKVEDFVLTRHGWYLECDKDVKYGTDRILTDKLFCKTWFLTQSEAEAKLKELRG
jgi:hypothetical protein